MCNLIGTWVENGEYPYETINIEDINKIADFCQQNHISTIHLMTNEQYGLKYKNTLNTYMKSKYGHNIVEVKINS